MWRGKLVSSQYIDGGELQNMTRERKGMRKGDMRLESKTRANQTRASLVSTKRCRDEACPRLAGPRLAGPRLAGPRLAGPRLFCLRLAGPSCRAGCMSCRAGYLLRTTIFARRPGT